MNYKFIVIILFLMIASGCLKKEPYPCPMCEGPAFAITMMDSTGKKLNGFSIRAIRTTGDTLFTNDSLNHMWHGDSSYIIYGGSGIYKTEITSLNYETINIDNITVEGGRCGPNPRILGIIAKEPKLSKKLNLPYIIAFDSSGVGCGN
jgi:hypothetical protein